MKIGTITLKTNPNNGVSLFYSGKFCGMFVDGNKISMSSNPGQIENEKLMVWILRKFHPRKTIYVRSVVGGNQHHTTVSTIEMCNCTKIYKSK